MRHKETTIVHTRRDKRAHESRSKEKIDNTRLSRRVVYVHIFKDRMILVSTLIKGTNENPGLGRDI